MGVIKEGPVWLWGWRWCTDRARGLDRTDGCLVDGLRGVEVVWDLVVDVECAEGDVVGVVGGVGGLLEGRIGCEGLALSVRLTKVGAIERVWAGVVL